MNPIYLEKYIFGWIKCYGCQCMIGIRSEYRKSSFDHNGIWYTEIGIRFQMRKIPVLGRE